MDFDILTFGDSGCPLLGLKVLKRMNYIHQVCKSSYIFETFFDLLFFLFRSGRLFNLCCRKSNICTEKSIGGGRCHVKINRCHSGQNSPPPPSPKNTQFLVQLLVIKIKCLLSKYFFLWTKISLGCGFVKWPNSRIRHVVSLCWNT